MVESHLVNLAKDNQIVDEFYYVDTLVNNDNVFDVEYDQQIMIYLLEEDGVITEFSE